jgi:hypothetical protein
MTSDACGRRPAGVVFCVGTPPADARINDTDLGFVCNQLDYSGNRGFGDYQDDLHYATSNGATVTYAFIGTRITVYGEQNTGSTAPTADPPLGLTPA